MSWIVNEDSALKYKLQGIKVFDENSGAGGRNVPVFFITPEVEVKNMVYPSIGIKPLGWFVDHTREHRGYIQLPYAPEGMPKWWASDATSIDPTQSPYKTWFPIPYNFDYQVTVFTRYHRQHLISIVAELAQYDRLHPHFGYLDIPQDGTKRSMFLNGGPEMVPLLDEKNKRLLTAVYNVRVCSELLGPVDAPDVYGGSSALARQLNLTLDAYQNTLDISYEEVQSSFGILSVGSLTGWNTQ